jgi:hypothetical protein
MIQLQFWPPPDWTECVVSWDYILQNRKPHPQALYDWCNRHASTGRYHVHGWQSTEGFAFRFEDQQDAIIFKLRWECE